MLYSEIALTYIAPSFGEFEGISSAIETRSATVETRSATVELHIMCHPGMKMGVLGNKVLLLLAFNKT